MVGWPLPLVGHGFSRTAGWPKGAKLRGVGAPGGAARLGGAARGHHPPRGPLSGPAPDTPRLSAHGLRSGSLAIDEAPLKGDALKAMLAERFGIHHATLELECHGHTSPEEAAHRTESARQ